MRRLGRLAALAVLALSLTGCRGCVPVWTQAESDAFVRRLMEQAYLRACGPRVIATGVGMAAPPGSFAAVSVLSAEAAWRELLWRGMSRLGNERQETANAAGVIGVAAPVGGCGGLSVLTTAVVQQAHAEQFPAMPRLRCLFEIDDLLSSPPR